MMLQPLEVAFVCYTHGTLISMTHKNFKAGRGAGGAAIAFEAAADLFR